MSNLVETAHGAARLAQRRIRDISLIELIGTPVEGGFLVTQKNYQAFEREAKGWLTRARRLIGKRIVVVEGRIVTAYHARRRQQRRLMRDAPESDLE